MLYSKKWDELYDVTESTITYETPQWSETTSPTTPATTSPPESTLSNALSILDSVRFISSEIKDQIREFSKYECKLGQITVFNDRPEFELHWKLQFIYKFIFNLSKKPTKNVKIFIFPLNIPKTVTNPIASVKNINSGVCIGNKVICIWRLEELTKVFAHELIHAHKLDMNHKYDKLLKLLKGFKISSSSYTAPNESITDTLTFLIISYLNGKWLQMNPEDIFKKEVFWTLKQMIKIWKRFDDVIEQETDVISYYFLKGIFLHHILYDKKKANLFLTRTILAVDLAHDPLEEIQRLVSNKNTYKQIKKTMTSLSQDDGNSLKMSFFSD
jgi:hypothetical protein